MDLRADDHLIGLDFQKDHPVDVREKKRGTKAKKYRLKNKIKVTTINKQLRIPRPIYSFQNKNCYIDDNILRNLSELAYKVPTPIQAQSIPIMMEHRNLLACAPTGSGKTVAYLLPVLNELLLTKPPDRVNSTDTLDGNMQLESKIFPFAIILAPTQELMHQIWSEAIRLCRGVQGDCYVAMLNQKHYSNRCKKNSDKTVATASVLQNSKKSRELRLHANTRILISTPSRLIALLSLPPKQCPFDFSRLCWIVVDECDKMLEVNFGDLSRLKSEHSDKEKYRPRGFHDQLAAILEATKTVHSNEQLQTRPAIALFSATIPDEVVLWAKSQLPAFLQTDNFALELVQLRVGIRNAAVSTVKQELRYCANEQGKLLEMRYLLANGLAYPCLIFMQSRERANEILKEILLSDANILVNVISSDKTIAQRSQVVRAFREGKLHVLICTDILGRGIDFKGVSMVVNYDVPASEQEYIHRVGRTGRAGHRGRAVTLWSDADLPHIDGILSVMKRSGSEVDAELDRLVNQWKTHRLNTLSKNKESNADRCMSSVISRRRGERRLAYKILKNSDRKRSKTADSEDKSMWLRPWNPHRGRISDVPGALSKKHETK
uniref:ATP-dependent RNA helicase n=1 Tax=Trichobilharzia regenti TaxID=157069 RepID=A0AA85JJT0_TRIRE|nr:unnamed protein product [Trichobilharzia regenti]